MRDLGFYRQEARVSFSLGGAQQELLISPNLLFLKPRRLKGRFLNTFLNPGYDAARKDAETHDKTSKKSQFKDDVAVEA